MISVHADMPTELPGTLGAGETFRSLTGDHPTLYAGTNVSLWRFDKIQSMWTKPLSHGCAGLDLDANGVVWCASDGAIYRDLSPTADLSAPGVTFTAIHVVGNDVYAVGLAGAIWHRTGLH